MLMFIHARFRPLSSAHGAFTTSTRTHFTPFTSVYNLIRVACCIDSSEMNANECCDVGVVDILTGDKNSIDNSQ